MTQHTYTLPLSLYPPPPPLPGREWVGWVCCGGSVTTFCTTTMQTYLSKSAIKDVHWTVVHAVLHVLDIVLHLHLDRVAVVVLTALELLVTVFSCQTLARVERQRKRRERERRKRGEREEGERGEIEGRGGGERDKLALYDCILTAKYIVFTLRLIVTSEISLNLSLLL